MARSALVALLAALAAVPAARAEDATPAQVAYVEGVRAFDAGDYATSAARMRVALGGDSREATARFRYRAQNAEDYFPHLWLGLSLEKLGDRDGAFAALRESQRQGAVDARPALRRILVAALARLTPPTAAPTPTPAAVPSPSPVPSVAPAPATPTAVGSPSPAAVPTPLRTQARRSPAEGLPPLPAGAAAETLRAGLRAFFRGEYESAEQLLAPRAERSAVARLFLAFSLGGRVLLGAGRDAALLSRAREEYSAALLAGAPVAAGPFVSPAILGLFGATTGPGTPPGSPPKPGVPPGG